MLMTEYFLFFLLLDLEASVFNSVIRVLRVLNEVLLVEMINTGIVRVILVDFGLAFHHFCTHLLRTLLHYFVLKRIIRFLVAFMSAFIFIVIRFGHVEDIHVLEEVPIINFTLDRAATIDLQPPFGALPSQRKGGSLIKD